MAATCAPEAGSGSDAHPVQIASAGARSQDQSRGISARSLRPSRRSGGFLKGPPVREYLRDIVLSLGDRRNPPVADPPRPSVIRGQGQMILAVPLNLLPQILRTTAQVARDIVAVDAELACGGAHQLGKTISGFGRIDGWVILAFANDQRVEEAKWDASLASRFAHQVKEHTPPMFAIRVQQAGRGIGSHCAAGSEAHRR